MVEYFSSEDHLISSPTDIQINMQLFIYFSLILVATSSAQQLKNGRQILSEVPSSSLPSHKIDERFVTPEFNLYFTPEEIQALQATQSAQNSAPIQTLKQNPGIGEESYNELIQKFYAENIKPAPIEEQQAEQKHASSNFFLPREESVYNKKPNFNLNTYRQLLMDQTKLSTHVQNEQKNKLNQLELFKPTTNFNKNQDQKSFIEKEKEYILGNGKNYQSKQINSPIPVRSQDSGRNVGQDQSAVDKEIENAWRQYLAHEIERLNSPAEISKQILSTRKENPKNIEVKKPISYILRNDQAYGFERSNAPSEVSNQVSQGRNEGQNESEVEKEIKEFWSKQQNSQLQSSFYPAGVINEGPSGIPENKKEADKQIENIFNQQDFGFEKSYSPAVVSHLRLSSKNENQQNSEIEKQFEYILKNRDAEFERSKALEVNNQIPFTNKDQYKSDVEKEIQNALKKRNDLEFQRAKSAAEAISQSAPVKIHEHVTITKHVPVPVLKTVQVAVPTPVLVPIPQPYEIKVPHLVPVPLKIVKHAPVSGLKHY